jgi:hypothetical protein
LDSLSRQRGSSIGVIAVGVLVCGTAGRWSSRRVCPFTCAAFAASGVKRDLLQCQKRPITVSKETYYSVKGDLLQCRKRPITVSKET